MKHKATVLILIWAVLGLLPCVAEATRVPVFTQDFESGLGPNEAFRGNFMINNSNTTLNNLTYMMGHPWNYLPKAYDRYLLTLDLGGYSNAEMSFQYKARISSHAGFNIKVYGSLLWPTPASDLGYKKWASVPEDYLGHYYYRTSGIDSGIARFDLSAYDNVAPTLLFQFYACKYGDSYPGINFDNILVTGEVLDVDIDVRPGNSKNTVNLDGGGALSVAILGSEAFDVQQVDPNTLELAGSRPPQLGKPGTFGKLRDVNRDGFTDLLLAFPIADLELAPDAVQAELTGRLLDGTRFLGADMIRAPGGPFGKKGELDSTAVPEPATLAFLAAGLILLRRRRAHSMTFTQEGKRRQR